MCLFAITAWSLPAQSQAAAYPGAFSHPQKALGSLGGWALGVLSPRGGGTRFSCANSHPAFLRNVCKGHVPAARAAPRRSSGSPGCAIALDPGGTAGLRHRQRGGPGQARCRAERAGQQRGAGRRHPASQIPHPTSLIPHPPGAPRRPSGAPRAVSVEGVPPKGEGGGRRLGAGPPRAPPQGEPRAPPRPHRGRLPCGTCRAPAARGAPFPPPGKPGQRGRLSAPRLRRGEFGVEGGRRGRRPL